MSLDVLVFHYLMCLQAEGKSPHTARWHRQSLKQFAEWVLANGVPNDPEESSVATIRLFILYNQERPLARGGQPSSSGLNSLIRSLCAFCTWLREEGYVNRDLFARVSVPKAPRLVQPTVSSEGVARLLTVIRKGRRNAIGDEAVLLFMLDTGARSSEVCTLRAE